MRSYALSRGRKHGTVLRALLMVFITAGPVWAASPALKLAGRDFVDPAGQPVVLKGCNLGNWLLLEPWMFDLRDSRIRDQHDFIEVLNTRFGSDRAERLLDTFRRHWITPRELDLIRSFDFNLVRVPFHHSLLATEEQPFELRDDAFEWLDRAVELAEQAGVYVILDMHGAPGGQSVEMPSGRVGENELWDSPQHQQRMAWLWQRIAERYRDRTSVVAYDLVNEPWGDLKQDLRATLTGLIDRVHAAIRKVDPDTLLLAPATLRGFRFYGHPHDRGWTNVGFTEHFYPGLFGLGSESLETHARFLAYAVNAKRRYTDQLGVPFLVGEFNVVFDHAAQPELMRRYYDRFAANNWLATMWSVRLLNREGGVRPNNWYLATNAEPFQLPDLHTASYEQLEHAFNRLGSQRLAVDEELRQALTSPRPELLPLAEPLALPDRAPGADSLPGWKTVDIAADLPGGQVRESNGDLTVYGAGSDIWSAHDEFRFVHHPADGDFAVQAWLTSFAAPHEYAKAGWMLRAGVEPDAAHLLLHAFPNGRVMLAWRSAAGRQMQERTLALSRLPVGLALERRGGVMQARFTDADGQWHTETVDQALNLGKEGLVGLAVLSHDEANLAAARFAGLGDPQYRPDLRTATAANLLDNASFEAVKDAQQAADQPRGWDRWGQWFNRESTWAPRRDGDCVLGYHHWRIDSDDNSGLYQDLVGFEPGARCTFRVRANRDVSQAGKHGPASIELRIESPHRGRLLRVASQTYQAADLATGEAWSLLQVTGTVPTDRARALIIVNPSRETPRDAAVKFDDASFHVVRASGP